MPKPTSVRLEEELSNRLDQLAASVGRPKTWLIEEAIKRYVEEEAWQVAAIASELAAHTHGAGLADLLPHDDVMARLEARINAKRATS